MKAFELPTARTSTVWLAAVVLAVSGASWLASARLGNEGMRTGLLTGPTPAEMSSADAMTMGMGLGLFLVAWVAMSAAMMLPGVYPVASTVHRWVQRTHRSPSTTAWFLAGYLMVWSLAGLGAYVPLLALHRHVAPGDPGAARFAGVLVVALGAYQLSPLKLACLRQCRSPLAFVAGHAERLAGRPVDAWAVGGLHGLVCLGCCWSLMLLLGLLGMMNLIWMALVAGVVLAEKAASKGAGIARAVGALLIVAGISVAVNPALLV